MAVPLKARCNSLARKMPSFGQSLKIGMWWRWNVLLPSLLWRSPECQETLGMFLMSSQSLKWAHCIFSSFCLMTKIWKQSPWGKTLKEVVDSRLSHLWALFYNHNQKPTETTPSVRKTPLYLILNQCWHTWTKQKTQHFVKGVQGGLFSKTGGKGKKKTLFPLHLEFQGTPKIWAHSDYKNLPFMLF